MSRCFSEGVNLLASLLVSALNHPHPFPPLLRPFLVFAEFNIQTPIAIAIFTATSILTLVPIPYSALRTPHSALHASSRRNATSKPRSLHPKKKGLKIAG